MNVIAEVSIANGTFEEWLKFFESYKSDREKFLVNEVIEKTSDKYSFPEEYLNTFNEAKKNFKIFSGKIIIDKIDIKTSLRDIDGLKSFLINDIEMSEKRVQNSLKKFHNNYNAPK